ncbi:unnamed protein product [Medioppia subpectinata]|uniref:non-specific serine/threonine protein kinase n=1 Tax=Medioppia subpectinata TaxID=1979941 RepID=A0A7R9PX47_9ACAR|nr:unnamed protein product [Medioppia subpectinata]CAG2104443.1 unnamed protein product [Medioppia subpectinata]
MSNETYNSRNKLKEKVGYNVLFVTNDDMVYGMGSNYYGSLGLGHNRAVNTPQWHLLLRLLVICGDIRWTDNKYETNEDFNDFTNGLVEFVKMGSGSFGTAYIETELCGQSLRTLLELKGPAFGRLSADEAMNLLEFFISCEMFKELLECIQYLHDLSPAVIHRDLKPDNILVSLNPQNGRCGYYHSLVLTSDGCVYGWGANMYSSFAVTTCGRVFSWGRNQCNLGHNTSDNNCDQDQNTTELNDYKRRYHELSVLGSGCFGTVYKVRHITDGQEYAVKIVDNPVLSQKGPAFGRRLAEEAMNLSEYYISCQIFKELLECIQCLHDLSPAVIHRDLKPENVLIACNAGKWRLKLCDFGLSEAFNRLTYKRNAKYLSPEETNGQTVDYKTDVYSAAKIAQNIFDLQLTRKFLRLYSMDKILSKSVTELQKVLISMQSLEPFDRPDCRQMH